MVTGSTFGFASETDLKFHVKALKGLRQDLFVIFS